MRTNPTLAAAIMVAGHAGLAAAQSGHNHGHAGHGPGAHAGPAGTQTTTDPMAPSPTDSAATREYKAGHKAMMEAMHVPFTGDADVDFRRHMIPHHQGAIDMAEVALRHAKDPDTKRMAEAIIAEQKREIAEMEAWLKAKGR
jgi:uncharacterized protein (DUF305 family)